MKDNPVGEHEPPRSEENILSEVLGTIRILDRRVRSIERSTTNVNRDIHAHRGSIHPRLLVREIRGMIKEDVPEEVIEEAMSTKAPLSRIRSYIRSASRELEEEDEPPQAEIFKSNE